MKEEDKLNHSNEWITDAIKEVGLETPSSEFTRNVLSKLAKNKVEDSQIEYRPLITKNGWAFVVLLVISVFVLSFDVGERESNGEQTILEKAFDFLSYDFFSGIQLSDTVVMGTVLFAVFACFQIITLKRFIEKQV